MSQFITITLRLKEMINEQILENFFNRFLKLYFLSFIFLIGKKLLYNFALVSVVQQCESVISYMYILSLLILPSLTPSHPSRSSQGVRLDSLFFSNFPLTIYYIYDNVYLSRPLSQLVPLSPYTTVSTSPFSSRFIFFKLRFI